MPIDVFQTCSELPVKCCFKRKRGPAFVLTNFLILDKALWQQTKFRNAPSRATNRRNSNNDELTEADRYGHSAHGFVLCY